MRMNPRPFVLALCLLHGMYIYGQDAQTYHIIVHPDNPATSISKKELKKIFLKRTTKWPNNQKMVPIDLSEEASARISFTRDVHRKSVSSIRAYWQKKLFSGRGVPPATFQKEADVVSFVGNNPGAISYVSESTQRKGVKTLMIVP